MGRPRGFGGSTAAVPRARQDVRAPGPWRANAPVMQSPAFGLAYACKAGMPMQPKPEARVVIFN